MNILLGDLESANAECVHRTNYTTQSDSSENDCLTKRHKICTNRNDYLNVFHGCLNDEEENRCSPAEIIFADQNTDYSQNLQKGSMEDQELVQSLNNNSPIQSITASPNNVLSSSNYGPIGNQSIPDFLVVDNTNLQTCLNNIKDLKKSNEELKHDNTNMKQKMDMLNDNFNKIMAQNEVIMQMIGEVCRVRRVDPSFVCIKHINSKQELDELEERLNDKEYCDNMVRFAFSI